MSSKQFSVIAEDQRSELSQLKVDNVPTPEEFQLLSPQQQFEAYKAAYQETLTDSDTGLLNHKAFKLLMQRIADDKQDTRSVQFLYLDMNFLKATNDLFRHTEGDNLIEQTRNFLKANYGEFDIFRLGGDEFVVVSRHSDITPDIDLDQYCQLNEDTARIKLHHFNQNQQDNLPHLELAFGVSVCQNPTSIQELNLSLASADERMAQAKNLNKQLIDVKFGINQPPQSNN